MRLVCPNRRICKHSGKETISRTIRRKGRRAGNIFYKMFSRNILLVLYALPACFGDWVSDWMVPVQDEFGAVKDLNTRRNDDAVLKMFEDEELRIGPMQDLPNPPSKVSNDAAVSEPSSYQLSSTLAEKLQSTLNTARALSEQLRGQILLVKNRELDLKEGIANGRSGVTSVTVHTLGAVPRAYLVRDGSWTLCNGVLQPPAGNPFSKQSSGPQCIGLEVPTKQDPCTFNSLTKYETIPTRRRLEYVEDDYLCLKRGFNNTMQHYMSVPKKMVNETCKDGTVKGLADHVVECGLRVLAEYTYYPGPGTPVPREYCAAACRLLVAWHVSNVTIENFEFLKDEPSFKKFFIKDSYVERLA